MADKGISVYTLNGEDYNINDPNIAGEFYPNSNYAVGDHVTHEGKLYVFTAAHTGAWTGTDVTQVQIGAELHDYGAHAMVRYDVAQTLTDAQKAVAQNNIGAAAASAIGTVPTGETVEGQITDLKSALKADNDIIRYETEINLVSGNITPTGIAGNNPSYIRNAATANIEITVGDIVVIDEPYQLFCAAIYTGNMIVSNFITQLTINNRQVLIVPNEYVGKRIGICINKKGHTSEDISADIATIGDYVHYYHGYDLNLLNIHESAITADFYILPLNLNRLPSFDYVGTILTVSFANNTALRGINTITNEIVVSSYINPTGAVFPDGYEPPEDFPEYDCYVIPPQYALVYNIDSRQVVPKRLSARGSAEIILLWTTSSGAILGQWAPYYHMRNFVSVTKQNWTETQQGIARSNIGAASDTVVNDIINLTGIKTDLTYAFDFTKNTGKRIVYANGILGAAVTGMPTDASSYIDISAFEELEITCCVFPSTNAAGLAFYSEASESAFVKGVHYKDKVGDTYSHYSVVNRIEVPEGANYLRVTWWSPESEHYGEQEFSCFGIVTREKELEDELPAYYFENNYIQDKVQTILSHRIPNGDSIAPMVEFVWFTDPHYFTSKATNNGLQGVNIAKYIAETTNITHVVCGGDLTTGIYTEEVMYGLFAKVIKHLTPIWPNLHMCIGNHEWNNQDAQHPDHQLNIQNLYNLLVKDKESQYGSIEPTLGSYWIDDNINKVRVFYLSCTYGAYLNNEMLNWMYQQLKTIPAHWSVFVCSHTGLSGSGDETEYFSRFAYVAGMLDALKEKTTYKVSSILDCDFTDMDVTVIGAITGHSHKDANKYTEHGVPIIGTTCDRGPTSSTTDAFNTARVYGTITEQAYDVVQIDMNARKIYTTRIGGSYDGTGPLENPDREFIY